MRNAFVNALLELADKDERVLLLTGDLGYTVLEPFTDRFPERFFNVGVAEQNMVGLATGLAEGGFVPFTYSIATFASMRPYEFIRNGPALHRLPVRIVGIGGGFDYGENGATHYALEDLALMRIQPEISVVVPADPDQARTAVLDTGQLSRPVYFRVGKATTSVPGLDGRFELGRAALIGDGSDLAIAVVGALAHEAVQTADLLAEKGVDATVVIVSSFNPSPEGDLADVLARVPVALTVEGHYITGALGSLVCEVVAERGLDCRVIRCGARGMPDGLSGSPEYLLQQNGLAPRNLARTALRAVEVGAVPRR